MDQVVDHGTFRLNRSPIRLPVTVLEPSFDGRIRIADANHWVLVEIIHGGTAMADMIAEAINAEV
jgi:hypothetical protein